MRTHALVAATGILLIGSQVRQPRPADAQASQSAARQVYPLNCRGGGRLAFDTIATRSDTGSVVRLALTFVANPKAAGMEGQGLQPGTCAWADRPVSDVEPREVRVTIHYSDSTPGRTVGDTGMYWSFLAYNSDSGYFAAPGYRHWHASSPPIPMTGQDPASAPSRGRQLLFKVLPWVVIAWVFFAWLPMLFLTGWWSGWRRLASLYPHRNVGLGRMFRCGQVLMGLANYRVGVRMAGDESHLHFFPGALLRPGHPPFSVPWSDITVARDAWPWFPLKGLPVIRITLAKHRALRILVSVACGERIVAASGGRLQVGEPRAVAAAPN